MKFNRINQENEMENAHEYLDNFMTTEFVSSFNEEHEEIFTEQIGNTLDYQRNTDVESNNQDSFMTQNEYDSEEEAVQAPNNGPHPMSGMSFIAKAMKCQLDDLSELLTNSEKFSRALQSTKASGRDFVDHSFPANSQSLVGYSQDATRRQQMSAFKWCKPNEYFQGKQVQVYDSLDSGDILQGGLGDCYFLAAISSIAEKPDRLKRLFLTKKNHGNGLYALALCLNGIWEEIIMDDYAPCDRSNKLAFNMSGTQELWVVLLEKAWAKVHGGYLNIEAGLTREALRDLTGASAKTYFTSQNPEDLWKKLMDGEVKNFVMTAGSDDLSGGSDAYIPKIGICGSHAYSLLAVYQLKQQGNTYRRVSEGQNYTERLVKLRNPWGQGEWKGEWADDDPKWTSTLKRDLGFTGVKEDGIFFMTWDQFLVYYSDVQICYFHDNYKYSAEKYTSQKNETVYIKFNLKTAGKYYFSVNQKNRRFFGPNDRYQYSHLSWVLGKAADAQNDCKFVGTGLKADKENWAVADCEAGEYYAMVFTPWRSLSKEFSYSIYGPGLTDLQQVSKSDLPENFMNDVFKSRAKADLEERGSSFAHRKHPGIKYVNSELNGWSSLYFENSEEEEYQIRVKLNFGNASSTVQVMPPYSSDKPIMTIKPGQNDVIVYKDANMKRIPVSMSTAFKKVGRTPPPAPKPTPTPQYNRPGTDDRYKPSTDNRYKPSSDNRYQPSNDGGGVRVKPKYDGGSYKPSHNPSGYKPYTPNSYKPSYTPGGYKPYTPGSYTPSYTPGGNNKPSYTPGGYKPYTPGGNYSYKPSYDNDSKLRPSYDAGRNKPSYYDGGGLKPSHSQGGSLRPSYDRSGRSGYTKPTYDYNGGRANNGVIGDDLKTKTRESKTVLSKKQNGREVDIKMHFHYHTDGLALLYVNGSSNMTLNEKLKFNLNNARIEGVHGDEIEFTLPPKEEKFIKVTKNGSGSYTSRLASMSYNVTGDSPQATPGRRYY